MAKKSSKVLLFSKLFCCLLIVALTAGCAGTQTTAKKAETPFSPVDLNPKIQSGKMIQSVDNVAVILDASATMLDSYKGQSKFDLAKTVVCRMNQTMPDLQLTAAMRNFGSRNTSSAYEAAPFILVSSAYLKAEFGQAVKGAKNLQGGSPLDLAIDATTEDLAAIQGKTAVLIFSDGVAMKSASVQKAAENMKSKLGDKVCIYTVQVGDDAKGKALLEAVAQIGQCGSAMNADSISSSEAMAAFVESVFLMDAPAPLDSDGDGVPNSIDQCPNTPKGATVDARGCWAYMSFMLFDFDSAVIKAEAETALQEAVKVAGMHPDLKVEIQGHTDNIGAAEYNMELSKRRAQAVRDYLAAAGVDSRRMTVEGFGSTMPVAPNDTEENRARNRRVEFKPMD